MKSCCDSRAKQKYDEIALGKSSNQAVQNTVKPCKGKESASPFVGLIASEHDNLCDGDQVGSFGSLATKPTIVYSIMCVIATTLGHWHRWPLKTMEFFFFLPRNKAILFSKKMTEFVF